ncbi:Putative flavin monooxygenase, FAD/NAD(P)-binding domain superfamily [Septoria linicola]|uniref:Flavin monooxygenase, FAD/NAD(P)-binding domain superfamily n=1 Tax=Septoria linicola TaxID=215465 RepID=A0A9Q9B008_9PEZI|nr:Putative flavin monooxygenase, FAD/NAD(P)-binding domain superfamily [Septoria linicola]
MVNLPIRRVAVIGAGPAGAITIDALMREKAFDLVRVFERRHEAGGCWSGDEGLPRAVTDIAKLGSRTADMPLAIPSALPAVTRASDQHRFDEATVYPYLETNVIADAMEFSQEPFPSNVSQFSKDLYGHKSPYRHWQVVRDYIHSLINRRGYQDLVSYNTSVENVRKVGSTWRVVLRKPGKEYDYWWSEDFDAVIVANGHYNVPFIPPIPGLGELEKSRPSVIHSKHFRGRDQYQGKRVVVVGGSVSAADIAFDLASVAESPVHAVNLKRTINVYFGDEAFKHPSIQRHPAISKVCGRSVYTEDGTVIENVDAIIFGTGYTWTLPFLPDVPVINNRIPGLYQHVVWQDDPTLLFVGAVQAGLTFKVFEWQAVYAASLLSGRGTLPTLATMKAWEDARVKLKGNGPKFALLFPDFKDYFEDLRRLSGEATDGKGRPLPKFRREWFRDFVSGHELRKKMWKRLNNEAKVKLDVGKERARL